MLRRWLGAGGLVAGVALAATLAGGTARASGGLTGSNSGPATATSGSVVSYTLTASDATITASGVTVTDVLDPGEVFLSVSPAALCSQTPAVGQSGLVTCNLGQPSIYSGQTQSVTVTAQIAPALGQTSITNSAEFSDGINSDVKSVVTTVGGALEVQGVPIAVAPNQSFTTTVATFTDPYCGSEAGYYVTIDWGDGTASYGTLSGSACSGAAIVGSHTYTSAGSYTVTTTVQGMTNAAFVVSGSSTATVGATSTTTAQPAYHPALPYSGMAFDPRCTYGCPPGGIP